MNDQTAGSSSSFFSIERVVTLLTPLVFAPLATWLSALIASNVPYAPHPSQGTLEGIEIAAFLGTIALVAKWLHGRQIPSVVALGKATGIKVSAEDLSAISGELKSYMAAHPELFQGPPGAVGSGGAGSLASEEAQAAIEAVVRRVLGGLGGSAQPVV